MGPETVIAGLTREGVGTALGALGGVAQVGYGLFAKNPAQRRNRQELERLLELERNGRLGLSGAEQRLMYQAATEPVRSYAAQQRQSYERMAATSGDQSGAELARLRQEQGRMTGRAAQDASLSIVAANEQKRQQQRQEIDQRTNAATRYSADRAQQVFGGIGQMAAAYGQQTGEQSGQTNGSPSLDAYLANLQRTDPAKYAELLRAATTAVTGG